MTPSTDRAPAHLLAFLEKHSVDFKFISPGVPVPTVLAAAAALGVSPDLILKTLLFTGEGGSYVIAIANGTRRVDPGLLSAVCGLDRLRPAKTEVVLDVTGYPAGGVAPLGLPVGLPVVVDVKVMALPVAYGGGGQDDLLLRLQPAEIVRLNSAQMARIVADDGPERGTLVEAAAAPR
jgi:prolyl-tRNA editing enzyme YbaK/EbsC (Cys-tRNA(Pro) deacylase)